MCQAVAVDVGGTTTKAALVTDQGKHSSFLSRPTPRDGASFVGETITQMVTALLEDNANQKIVEPVGVCIPGIVNDETGVGVLSANLGWKDAPFKEMLEERLGRPVVVSQDIRTGARAEAKWGVNQDTFLYLPLGTGIASTLIVNQKPVLLDPWAGEIGQLKVADPDGPGTVRLEEVASASGIARRAQLQGLVVPGTSAQQICELAQSNHQIEELLRSSMQLLADALSAALATIGAIPIVIGGGLAQSKEMILGLIAQGMRRRLPESMPITIIPASLRDKSQLLGAGLLALEEAQNR